MITPVGTDYQTIDTGQGSGFLAPKGTNYQTIDTGQGSGFLAPKGADYQTIDTGQGSGFLAPKNYGWQTVDTGRGSGFLSGYPKYAEGGAVKQNKTQALADHAMDVYDDFHDAMRNQHTNNMVMGAGMAADQAAGDDQSDGNYAEGGAVQPTGGGPTPTSDITTGSPGSPSDAGTMTNVQSGGAQKSGIPAPGPGPAGAGVTPQAPSGNPGRPNWTDPNGQAASDKNFYQNVTSMPATSPARGTAFSNPTPIGGQRGQEWYGKNAAMNPYKDNRGARAGIPATPGGR
jgi:hypothetical protein